MICHKLENIHHFYQYCIRMGFLSEVHYIKKKISYIFIVININTSKILLISFIFSFPKITMLNFFLYKLNTEQNRFDHFSINTNQLIYL